MATRRQRGEGSVYRRGDGQWVGTLDLGWVDGKRKRKAIYGKTQAIVVKKLATAKREQAAGQLTASSLTVEKWTAYWLESIATPRVKPRTLAAYRTYVNQYIVPAIGKVRLDRLTVTHVRAVHAKATEDGRSSTTAMHAHRVLSTALTDAVREGRLGVNVAQRISAPTKAASTRRPLSLPEARALFAQVDADRLASRWQTALVLGMRQGECLGLTWEYVDLDAATLDTAWELQRIPYRHGCNPPCGSKRPGACPARHVHIPDKYARRHLEGNYYLLPPKTKGSSRLIGIPEPLLTSFRNRHAAYLGERNSYAVDYGLVWCRPDGRPLDPSNDYDAWQDHLAAAGLPPLALHSARHTAASIMALLGITEPVVMSIMGHSEVTTTRGYTHTDLTLQRAALDRLGEALRITAG